MTFDIFKKTCSSLGLRYVIGGESLSNYRASGNINRKSVSVYMLQTDIEKILQTGNEFFSFRVLEDVSKKGKMNERKVNGGNGPSVLFEVAGNESIIKIYCLRACVSDTYLFSSNFKVFPYSVIFPEKNAGDFFIPNDPRGFVEINGDGKEMDVVQSNFTSIYNNNSWGSKETRSGPGSGLSETKIIRQYFPLLLREKKIKSIFDAGCGDFCWTKEMMPFFREMDISYLGMDVVEEVIKNNSNIFKDEKGISFENGDITSVPIKKYDLILCKDCLFHLPLELIKKALNNFKSSGSKYLLTSSFLERGRQGNVEIYPGQYFNLTLIEPPFNFSMPEIAIRASFMDRKMLCLWDLQKIPSF